MAAYDQPFAPGYGFIGYNRDGTENHAYACNSKHVGFLIGARGTTIRLIQQDSDAKVKVQQPQPEFDRSTTWFLIRGYSHQCQAAIRHMNQLLGEVIRRDDQTEAEINETPFEIWT